MKTIGTLLILMVLSTLPGFAQEPIYRCGNEYTNAKPDALNSKGCKRVEGGNVTVVQGTRVARAAPVASTATVSPKIDNPVQKTRDSDARLILQAELKKALARQDELRSEFNNGEPEKRADETRNHQKYLDRIAELKASMARIDSDIAGIRRELERSPAARP